MKLNIRGSIKAKFAKKEKRELAYAIKNIFGFYPKNIFLYALAFRHKSVALELQDGIKNSNERLEYLGDAILSAVVADYLFKIFPYKNEGFLTKLRSKMVSRSQLNKLSLKLGLHDLVKSTKEKGNQPKSMNGDAFEALIGAMYLDKGYEFTRKIIINRIYKYYLDIDELAITETNYKSKLIEWSQKEKKLLEFRHKQIIDGSSKNLHLIELYIDNKLITTAKASSIKDAEQYVAEKAYLEIDKIITP